MKTVVVLGGGPAGAIAAERLASAGLKTTLFDEKLAWEKPCGGGLTYKAYRDYPFLTDSDTPKRLVRETRIAAPGAGQVRMQLARPLIVYSRIDLNRMLLERAGRAGATIEKARVLAMDRRNQGWRLRTQSGGFDADYCIIATGARNPLREAGTQWSGGDTMTALGYYVPGAQEEIDIQFERGMAGYIWVFPRCGHRSAGICGKGQPARLLRERLERYLDERGIAWRGSQFYGHVLPSLDTPGWKRNRVAGDGWLAVGDAAGLVDPITGEGLYYAIRSGDLASQVVIDDTVAPEAKGEAYRSLLAREFAADLEHAATLSERFYNGRFLRGSIPARMIQFTRRSPRFRGVMQDLFAGTQPYLGLKQRLFDNLAGMAREVIAGSFAREAI